MNTFKDSRKSGDDTQKEPEELVDGKVKKGDSWIGRLVRSEHFELFLDIVLNRKQGLFWRYQHRVVLELLRNDGDQAEQNFYHQLMDTFVKVIIALILVNMLAIVLFPWNIV